MNRYFILFSLVALSALTAAGAPVTFDTAGSQLCVGADGCGATKWVGANITISYLAASASTISAPSNANLGSLQVTCNGGGTSCAMNTLPANLTLYIKINESAPAPGGSGLIPGGSLAGTISGNGSLATINWAANAATVIGNTSYSITNLSLDLVPASTNHGVTTIQAFVNTPEPGSLLLLSSGLVGMLFVRHRKQ